MLGELFSLLKAGWGGGLGKDLLCPEAEANSKVSRLKLQALRLKKRRSSFADENPEISCSSKAKLLEEEKQSPLAEPPKGRDGGDFFFLHSR